MSTQSWLNLIKAGTSMLKFNCKSCSFGGFFHLSLFVQIMLGGLQDGRHSMRESRHSGHINNNQTAWNSNVRSGILSGIRLFFLRLVHMSTSISTKGNQESSVESYNFSIMQEL